MSGGFRVSRRLDRPVSGAMSVSGRPAPEMPPCEVWGKIPHRFDIGLMDFLATSSSCDDVPGRFRRPTGNSGYHMCDEQPAI